MRTGRVAATVVVVIGVGRQAGCFETRRRALGRPPARSGDSGHRRHRTAQDVPVFVQGLGTVQAINTVNVKSRVDGQIMQAFFTQGQEVQRTTSCS